MVKKLLKYCFLPLVALFYASFANGQKPGVQIGYEVHGKDTIYVDRINELHVFNRPQSWKKSREWRKFYRTVYNFAKVYPYALKAKAIMREADSTLASSNFTRAQREKYIKDYEKRLFKEFIIHDKPAGQMEICLLKEILLLTGRYARMEQNKSMPLLAIEYIHSHYKEVVDVDQLARLERMSCTTFRIAFKKHTGISPNEYIIAQRISVACRLLAQTELSVKEIAGEVGYADQYYFSRIFKKKVGMTPLKYRKN